jgi:hypothetical protein
MSLRRAGVAFGDQTIAEWMRKLSCRPSEVPSAEATNAA